MFEILSNEEIAPLVHRLVVDRDVRRIFEYRRRALLQLFESPADGPV